MKKDRIRIDGVLYEAVDRDWRDNIPDYIGDWEDAGGDSLLLLRLGDMSYLEVAVTYGDKRENELTVDVWLDGGYPEQLTDTVSVTVPEDGILDVIKTFLDALDPVMDKYGYDVENAIDSKAEEFDYEPGQYTYFSDDFDGDDGFFDSLDKFSDAADKALKRAERKIH